MNQLFYISVLWAHLMTSILVHASGTKNSFTGAVRQKIGTSSEQTSSQYALYYDWSVSVSYSPISPESVEVVELNIAAQTYTPTVQFNGSFWETVGEDLQSRTLGQIDKSYIKSVQYSGDRLLIQFNDSAFLEALEVKLKENKFTLINPRSFNDASWRPGPWSRIWNRISGVLTTNDWPSNHEIFFNNEPKDFAEESRCLQVLELMRFRGRL